MYHFREVTIKNGQHEHKVLTIDFSDPKMAIVSEFLISDASLLQAKVLFDIDAVLNGQIDSIEVSGNRCALEIKRKTTLITDLFTDLYDDFVPLASYEMETEQLRKLIVLWLDEKKKRES